MGRRPKPAPEWSIVSQHCGTITSNDVPRLMKKLLQEEFPSKIAKGLAVPKESLEKYAKGQVAMRWSVGKRFAFYLDERAEAAEKEKAVPAATETTQKSEDTQDETSPVIVPQEEEKDMTVKTGQVTDQVADQAAETEALRAELEAAKEQIDAKTFEAADLRANLKTRTDETVELRAQINDLKAQRDELGNEVNDLNAQNANLRKAVDDLTKAAGENERENEMLRRRISLFEQDNEACGPARVDQLESRVAELELEHLDDLTLIRDLTKRLLK